jgi:hypothetical protein
MNAYKTGVVMLLVFGFIVVGFIYNIFSAMSEAAQLEYLSEMADVVNKQFNNGKFELKEKSRELTKEEVQQMVYLKNKLVCLKNKDDCSNPPAFTDKLHIAIGEVNKESKLKIKVWIEGNENLVIPYGEKAP